MSRTALSSPALATALADRFREIAPAAFLIEADGNDIVISRDGNELTRSHAPGILENDQPGLPEERIETIAQAALDSLQDVVAEELMEPWPARTGSVPLPDTRLIGNRLMMWFGDEERPAINLRPIDFDR